MSFTRALARTRVQAHRYSVRSFVSVTKPAWNIQTPSSAHPGTGNPSIVDRLPNTAQEMPQQTPIPASEGLAEPSTNGTDWSKSYSGLSTQAFNKEVTDTLLAPINPLDVEMKPGE